MESREHELGIIPRSGSRFAEKNDAGSKKSEQASAGQPADACSGRIAIIADDDEFFRLAVAALLTRHLGFDEVVETSSLDEAVARLSDRPDTGLALFDLRMPGMASAASLSAVRECFPQVRAVILSASTERRDILLALEAGAHGYIPKTFGAAEIVRALQLILDGLIFVPSLLAEVPSAGAASLINGAPETPDRPTDAASLTRRQREVLDLITKGKSNKEIGRVLGLGEGTVKVHVAALLRSLGVANRAAAAVAGAQVLREGAARSA